MATTTATSLSLLPTLSTTPNHRLLHHRHRHRLPPPHLHRPPLSHPKPTTAIPLSLLKFSAKPQKPTFLCFSSLTPPPPPSPPPPPPPPQPNSTKTLAYLFALSLSLISKIAHIITTSLLKFKSLTLTLSPDHLQFAQFLNDNLVCTAGPLFFAAIKDRPPGYLNTPLTVIASGMAKWLDIYSGVLMVRVLLSWFPNIPWDRQPLSAIRDLCDPYLNLFRNIIPPVFDTLDVSPLFAFGVLGVLASILNTAKQVY